MRKYYILYINNNIIRKKKKELPPLPLFSFRETRDRKRQLAVPEPAPCEARPRMPASVNHGLTTDETCARE
ncbi:hypothetical protein DWW16_08050 [Bacteroides clarus]|uniref:Uncharacterized protein n=1 Tax=Bacteroides clarus TaxID=626929 RepID=A0A412Y0H7_9BACE|nr:hypothetical protein DWW16_08050 [Bacteroides clarus]RGV51042.1 hypothetical protein DWW09_13940 [Bacteroides clarus]